MPPARAANRPDVVAAITQGGDTPRNGGDRYVQGFSQRRGRMLSGAYQFERFVQPTLDAEGSLVNHEKLLPEWGLIEGKVYRFLIDLSSCAGWGVRPQ